MGYRGLQGLTGGKSGLQRVTRGYKGYRGLQRVTRGYKGLKVKGGFSGLQGVRRG